MKKLLSVVYDVKGDIVAPQTSVSHAHAIRGFQHAAKQDPSFIFATYAEDFYLVTFELTVTDSGVEVVEVARTHFSDFLVKEGDK